MKGISNYILKTLTVIFILFHTSCAIVNVDKENRGDIIGKIGSFGQLREIGNVKVYLEGKKDGAISLQNSNTFSFKDLKPSKYNVIMELLDYPNILYIIKDVEVKKDKMAFINFPWLSGSTMRYVITPLKTKSTIDTLKGKDGSITRIVKNEWQWDVKEIARNDIFKRGSIEGMVKDSTNKMHGSNVNVWLYNGNESDPKTLIYKATTDNNSYFNITGIQPGLYELHFSSNSSTGTWSYFNNVLIKADSTAISGDLSWLENQPNYIPEPSNTIHGIEWTMNYK